MKDYTGKYVQPSLMREMFSALPCGLDGIHVVEWSTILIHNITPIDYQDLSHAEQVQLIKSFRALRRLLQTVAEPEEEPVLIGKPGRYYALTAEGDEFYPLEYTGGKHLGFGLTTETVDPGHSIWYYRPEEKDIIDKTPPNTHQPFQFYSLDSESFFPEERLDPNSDLFDMERMLYRGIIAAMNTPKIEKDYEVYYEHPGYSVLNGTSERVVYNLITGHLCMLKDVIKRSPGRFNGVILMQYRPSKINYAKSTDVPLSMLDMVEDRSDVDEKPHRSSIFGLMPSGLQRPDWANEPPVFEQPEYIQLDTADCEEIKDLLEAVATLDEAYDRQRLNHIVLKHYGIG